ncbi:MAG TPA: glycosyltransferase [Longimicrobium sp.]|nr:glycosyltransferase [Longimicrobium sp.]
METLFYLCAALVVYTAVLYPAGLIALGLLRRVRPAAPGYAPRVSVIVAACNEEEHLRAKLEQTLSLSYPAGEMEVIVAVDEGSADRTVEIARAFEPRGIRVCLSPVRGKNASMDRAVAMATGEILVFTDAAGVLGRDAVLYLAAVFRDPRVGCVGGRLLFREHDAPGVREDGVYWRLERALYRGSSVLGYLPSTPGTIHALRRSIYRPVGNHLVRDMVDPAQAAALGYRVVLEERAECLEVPWSGVGEIFRNRVRSTMRSTWAVPCVVGGLLRGRRWTAAFQFVSHKLLRQQIWVPLAGMLACSLWLAPTRPGYAAIAAGLLAGCAAGGVGLLAAWRGRRVPGLSMAGYMLLTVAAMGVGTLRCFVGQRAVLWRTPVHPPLPA